MEPGMVVAIDPRSPPGQLHIADRATTARWPAGSTRARSMQQEGAVPAGSLPVALSGGVYCWADASYGAIQAGDLLTTSDTPGHLVNELSQCW